MAQGIQIGDAVLKMFVDWTEIDQVGANLPAHLKPGTDAAISLGQGFDSVGKSAGVAGTQAAAAGDKIALAGKAGADAFKGADTATQALVARIKTLEGESQVLGQQVERLQAQLLQFGKSGEDAGRRTGASMAEARGTLTLLGDDIGLRLPRHVRTFLSEIPGVSAALSAAFAPVAIFTLLEVLDQIPKKLIEMQDALAGFDEAKKKAFEADSTGFLSQLNEGIGLLKEETIQQAAAGKSGIDATKAQVAGLSEYQQKLSFAQRELVSFKKAIEDVAKTPITDAVKGLDLGERTGVISTLPEETERNRKNLEAQFAELSRYATELSTKYKIVLPIPELPPDGASESSIKKALDDLNKKVSEYIVKFTNDQAQLTEQGAEENARLQKEGLDQQAANLKRNLDSQLAKIESFKVQQQIAYAEGTISAEQWAKAQITAANASAKAQIDYKDNLVAVAKASGDEQKILAASQDATTEKLKQQNKLLLDAAQAIQKAKENAIQLHLELDKQDLAGAKLDSAEIKKTQQALDELTKAELRLGEAEKNLKEIQISSEFSAQEAQIKRLADFSVISEQQKEARLKTLYERERQDALKALTDLQSQELATLNAAKAKFQTASADPFFSDAQLADLKRKLDEAQVAYDNTQGQIIKVTDQYKAKLEGLNLAERQAIASELALAKAKEAQLQAQRAQLTAEGGDTTAINKEISATKQYENELTRLLARMTGVTKTKTTWDSFFTDLITRSLSAGQAMQQMGQLFSDAIGQSVEAAVNGQETFGEAMLQFVKSTLASLAGAAVGHVLTEIAKASSDFATAATLAADPFTAALAPGFIASAHAHLVAAAEWGALGAGAAVGGAAIPGGGSSSSSATGGNNVSPSSIGENGQASQQPVFIQNVQHMAGGGVAEKRKLVVVGDAPGGGDAAEGIIPLNDERAKQRIANALFGNMVAAFSGFTPEKARTILPRESVAEIIRPQPFARATLQVAREAGQVSREADAARSHQAPSQSPVVNHFERHEHNHTWNIEGIISDDKLDKVMKKMSDRVSSGKARLKSSTTYRVTKRG